MPLQRLLYIGTVTCLKLPAYGHGDQASTYDV